MSKYDAERKKLGLNLNNVVQSKPNTNTKSKYGDERKALFENVPAPAKNIPPAKLALDTNSALNYAGVKSKSAIEKKMQKQSFELQKTLPYGIDNTPKKAPENFVGKIPAPVSFAAGVGDTATMGLIESTANRKSKGVPDLGNKNQIVKNFFEAAKTENPKAYTGGQVAGYFVPGTAIDRGAGTLLKGATKALPTIAKRQVIGGISGAVQQGAESLIRQEDAKTAAGKVLLGAGFGAVADLALTGAGKVINKVTGKEVKNLTQNQIKAIAENQSATKPLNANLSPNNLDNINTQPLPSSTPTMANKSVAEDIGLRGNNQTETLTIKPESLQKPVKTFEPKERRFSINVQGSKDTPEAITKQLTEDKLTYNPISEKKTLDVAVKRIESNPDKAYSDVLTGTGKGISRDDVATGELLIKQAFDKGETEKAYTLISHIAEKLTESGQAIQAAAMFKRMTPEGMLLYAEKAVNKANRELGKGVKEGRFADPLKKFYKKGALTDEMKNKIKTDMEDVMKLPEGRDKDIKLASIMQTISEAMPKAPLSKLESFRTIAMLSNPKTWIRNFVSNAAFGGIEAGATKPLSAFTDRLLSFRTGQRSTLNTQYGELAKGFKQGVSNALDDVKKGIDTSPTRGALELPRPNEFKNIPVLGTMEKAVKLGVSGGDRPFYEAAYKDALKEQLKLHEINTGQKLTQATEEMKQAADEMAKYRTYADSNMLSNSLTKIKTGLNKFRVGGIGAGDVLMKFTRTPANLVARGIDYSPAGLVKGVIDISRVIGGNKEIQRQAAEGFSRGVIGTGFVTAAIALTNLGIIRGERQKSNTANAFEQAVGKGQYTINISALQRYISSGMDPKAAEEQQGDTVSTYDWAQPLALSTSVGANIGEDLRRKQKVDPLNLVGTIAESMASGANTIIEQPMLQNINRVFKGDNPVQGLMSVVQDYPASFVPAFISGMRYAADPYIRDTSGSVLDSAGKRVVNKIPFASQKLDKTTDILGNERKVTAKTPLGRLADSAFNPTRITKVNYTAATKEIDRLYKTSRDGNILPNLVERTETIASPKKGEPAKDLTPEQRTQYQKILADNYLKFADNLIKSPGWLLIKEELKVDRLSSARTRADNIAKKEMQKIVFSK